MELHEYQKRIANFIAKHPHCILSVDMGLGKTASVLAWLRWHIAKHPEHMRTLIIAPKRVSETVWLQEAQKWGWQDLADRMVIVKGTPDKRKVLAFRTPDKPVKVCSRENLQELRCSDWDIVILDELTSYKNPDASRTKIVCNQIHADIRIGLTGTFLANGAIDIYGQAAACGLGWHGLNFYAWRGTYFRDVLKGSGLAFSKWQLNHPLQELLQPIADNIFTLTAEDYLTIPPVTEHTHTVDVGESTRNAIAEFDAFLSTTIGTEVFTIDEKQKFAKLQTLCNGFVYDEDCQPVRGAVSRKLEAVADFVADCKDAGEPVLLFYAFREEAVWLQELLKARHVHCESVKRAGFVERWEAGEIDCLFAHPASAGHGLNLQHGGRIVVWSTLTYNYELFAQGNARLARQGQTRPVQMHYFVADKTCEVRAVAALSKKQADQNTFLELTKQ